MARTRRVVNERPSRTRSTSKTIGTRGSPGRRKYECRECTARSGSTVRPAAIRACPATWPPKTRVGLCGGRCRGTGPLELLEVEQPDEPVERGLAGTTPSA